MARIRSVHPEICVDETLPEVSAHAERTFVRLWTHCDDEGRCIDNARLIKAALYPLHDDMTPEQVDHDLKELAHHGLIWRYEAEGKRLLCAKPGPWSNWQKPKHPQGSKLPGPPDGYTPPPEPPRNDPERSGTQRNEVERNGAERSEVEPSGDSRAGSLHGVVDGEGVVVGVGVRAPERPGTLALVRSNGSPPAVAGGGGGLLVSYAVDFEAWWVLYPRKVAKRDAEKAYRNALGHVGQRHLADGLERSIAAWRREGRAQDKIPYAASWLRGRCWEDDYDSAPAQSAEPKAHDGIRRALQRRGSA